jgi:protein TonB
VLTAPLAPTVTVRSRQGVGGSGTRGGSSAADGQFAAPNYGTNPLPSYPLLARERGYQGTVYLRVQIQPDGRVGRLAIDRSSGFEILDRAATDSVKEWTFLPARRSGKPVDSWVVLPVKFKLD